MQGKKSRHSWYTDKSVENREGTVWNVMCGIFLVLTHNIHKQTTLYTSKVILLKMTPVCAHRTGKRPH
jgi:hypothetical protein